MIIQATISDSKEIFHKEFPYVIPALYRKLSDELLVELHLLSHQKGFEINPIFSTGLCEIFDVFTEGYQPEKHKKDLFNALCESNDINGTEVRNESTRLLEKINSLNTDSIERFIDDELKNVNSELLYNRITAIGFYKIAENINKDENTQEEERLKVIKILTEIVGFEIDRVEKDIKLFTDNIEKLKQSLDIIKQNLEKKSK